MGCRPMLKSLSVQRNTVIQIILLTSLVKLDYQSICKGSEGGGLIGIKRRVKLKNLFVQRNTLIKITVLTSLPKLDL